MGLIATKLRVTNGVEGITMHLTDYTGQETTYTLSDNAARQLLIEMDKVKALVPKYKLLTPETTLQQAALLYGVLSEEIAEIIDTYSDDYQSF